MSLFTAMEISASGMAAEKFRLDLVAGNLANINTTRTAAGGPYRRRTAVFSEVLESVPGRGARGPNGVRVSRVISDRSEPRRVYDPDHPDAVNGYVSYPNIDVTREVVDALTASRAYESNVTVFNAAKAMNLKALEIGR